jgi:hypothetical protein
VVEAPTLEEEEAAVQQKPWLAEQEQKLEAPQIQQLR